MPVTLGKAHESCPAHTQPAAVAAPVISVTPGQVRVSCHTLVLAPCWQAGAQLIVSPSHSSGFCRHYQGLAPLQLSIVQYYRALLSSEAPQPDTREGAATSVLSSRGAILSSPQPRRAKFQHFPRSTFSSPFHVTGSAVVRSLSQLPMQPPACVRSSAAPTDAAAASPATRGKLLSDFGLFAKLSVFVAARSPAIVVQSR